jgi:hypothetical protein
LARALVYLREHPEAGKETAANGGMEDAATGKPAPEGIDWQTEDMPGGWANWLRPGTPGQLVWTTKKAHQGKASLCATGAAASCFLQSIPVSPGEQYLCSAYALGKVSESSKVELFVQWQDKDAKWFQAPPSSCRLSAGETGDWERLQTLFTVPPGVARAIVCLTVYDQAEGDTVYFDDVSCLRLDIPGAGEAKP